MQTCGKPIDTLMERVLSMNILASDYFRGLFRLKTYHEVIDEIYYQVSHVEPWMTGNCRGPSTAFCLLYKFFTMKLTVKQVQGLITHADSPYIRAVGFLYIRYMAEPKTLWGWCEPYIKDSEEFSPGTNGKNTTMGNYVRDLLLGQYYFDSLFPRIPVLISRQIISNLEALKLPTQPSGVAASADRSGADDSAARRPPSVKAALERSAEKEKKSAVSDQLKKLRDLYGDGGSKKEAQPSQGYRGRGDDEVIRLGGSTWK
ncbi:unnamed protein product [Closterium sp. NIES-64]|nr:unnamed protein product [Closterium sp. NIES-64]